MVLTVYGTGYSLCRENILVLDIFFEALNYETIEQKKAYEVAALLGMSVSVSVCRHEFPHVMAGSEGEWAGGRQADSTLNVLMMPSVPEW